MEQRDNWHLTEQLHNATGRGDPFAAAVRGTRMPMVITDPSQPDNPIVFVNEAFQKLTGYTREEIMGRNCRFLQGPETDESEVTRIRRAIGKGESIDVDLLNYRKDGSTFWNALYLSPVRNDQGNILFYFASQLDVTDRVEAHAVVEKQRSLVDREVKRRTSELQAALDAKTLLIHEVDHRVKNNLNMVSSLLRMQARSIGDPAVADTLNSMLERLDALGTVHRRLYQGEDIVRFDICGFLANLVDDILGASGRQDITLQSSLEPIFVASGIASALGLVLNEIVINAIKHAFADGRPGVLSVSSCLQGEAARIVIADDGPGVNVGKKPSSGLGSTLITRLSRQAQARVTFAQRAPGTEVTLAFNAGLAA